MTRVSPFSSSCYDVCEMEITGLAFLWHQVRCMTGVLFLVGMRLEKPEVGSVSSYHLAVHGVRRIIHKAYFR